MRPWEVLKAVTKLVDGSGVPDHPPNRLALLWHIALGSLAIVLRRRNVAVLPNKLNVGTEGVVLTDSASFRDVLFTSLLRRRPAFVLPGTLASLCEFFGVDEDHVLTLHCGSSGLAICFGHLQGKDVVVHADPGGDGKRAWRQSEGTKVGAEVLGALVPRVLEVRPGRLITERMSGEPKTPWKLREAQLQAAILAALEPLKQIYDSGHWTRNADHELIKELESYVRQSPHQKQLQPGLDLIHQWDRSHIRAVVVHGDYWLNNILFFEGRVTAVVDWDRERADGCAGLDALHLAFMSYAMWSDIPVSELLASIFTGRWRFPWLASYCGLVKDAFSLDTDDLRYLAILLWLSYFPFHDDLHPKLQTNCSCRSRTEDWYAQMIAPMSEAIVMMQPRPVFRAPA